MLLTNAEKDWIAGCTARLRLVQADAAALPAQERQAFLGEEITRKLREIPKPAHKRLLETLLEQFPVAGQVARSLPPPPPTPPIVEKPPVASFPEVFDCFLNLAKDLPETEKQQVIQKLAQAGLAPASQGAVPPEVIESLRKELAWSAGQEPHPTRLAELAAVLVALLCRVDKAAFGALRQLSPRNPLLRAEGVQKMLGQYLLSEQPASTPLTRAFEALTGAMLTALLQGGAEFGRRYLERMSPEMIWEVVRAEAKLWENKKELAWEKYKDLAQDYATVEQINKLVKAALAATIDASLNR